MWYESTGTKLHRRAWGGHCEFPRQTRIDVHSGGAERNSTVARSRASLDVLATTIDRLRNVFQWIFEVEAEELGIFANHDC